MHGSVIPPQAARLCTRTLTRTRRLDYDYDYDYAGWATEKLPAFLSSRFRLARNWSVQVTPPFSLHSYADG